jgi:hypothetical protein
MSYTLWDATLDLARVLLDVHEGMATTTGSTTSLTDTRNGEPSGYYVGGTIWVPARSGPIAAVSKYVSAFAANAFTFDAITNTISTNDRYMAAGPKFPQYMLKQAINAALREIGPIMTETTFTATANQTEYTATEVSAVAEDILAIDLAASASSPYYWTPHYRWRQVPSASRKLVFAEGSAPGNAYPVRLIYTAQHGELTADADVISSYIHPDLLKWTAAVHCWRWRMQKVKTDEPDAALMYQDASKALEAEIAQMQLRMQEAQAFATEARSNYNRAVQQYQLSRQRVIRAGWI